MTFYEARDKYREGDGHFFDNDTMMFWNSEVFPELYGDQYFITSEPNYDGKDRRFTIRAFSYDYTGVETVGEFRQHGTLAEAKAVIKDLLH